MLLRRASSLLRRVHSPFRITCAVGSAAIFSANPLSSNTKLLSRYKIGFDKQRDHNMDLALWIVLSGQAAIILGIDTIHAEGEDVLAADMKTGSDTGDVSVSGLRLIEDGSVISNSHTSKWRVFTDSGRDLFQQGKLDEAEKYFSLALQEAKAGFGERDPHVASACNNLAELYRIRKAFEKAEPLYLEAINILEQSLGPEDIRVGFAFHNLGGFHLSQRKLEQAKLCYERALKIKGQVLGLGHPDYANALFHLAEVLHLLGKVKDSIALIQDSIRILEEGGQGQSMTCIRRLMHLAQILLKSNQLQEAENVQRKALHVLEMTKGWGSLDTIVAADSLALTLQSVGRLTEAHELLERCLDARRTLLHEGHIQVGANMLHLARVIMLKSSRLRKGNISEATAELDKAKVLLENSIRIARQILLNTKKGTNDIGSNGDPRKFEKDQHSALVIWMQALDALGLLEMTKHELKEQKEANGALVECKLASMAPDRILSLALLNATGGGYECFPKIDSQMISIALRFLKARTPEQRAAVDLDTHYTKEYLDEYVGSTTRRKILYQEYVKAISSTGMQSNYGFEGQVNACWTHKMTPKEYDVIRSSGFLISVIHGRHDIIAQVHYARKIAERLYPNARMIELHGGHLVSHERPEEVNQALMELIKASKSKLDPQEWSNLSVKEVGCQELELSMPSRTRINDRRSCFPYIFDLLTKLQLRFVYVFGLFVMAFEHARRIFSNLKPVRVGASLT